MPPLYAIIARDLQADESQLGWITAVYILLLALAAAFWGYRGDKGQRKNLLLYGTIIWGTGMISSGFAQSFWGLFGWQMITAVGVGSIASIGFSIVSDLIPAHRRGFALSLWSISQGIGVTFGSLLASTIGSLNWRWPFFAIAALGLLFAFLYLFTIEPQRGQAEPELQPLFKKGQSYQHLINRHDLKIIIGKQTNRWLIFQGFLLSFAYGSTIWVPRWAIARVQAEGFDLDTATLIGNLFVTLFGIGGFLAIPAGQLGDRLQLKNKRARAIICATGLLISVPFFIALFFIPFKGVVVPTNGTILETSWAVLISIVTNGWVALAFLTTLIAISLFSAEPPNRAAILTDVNLPEHRGTVVGISRLSRAIANALSVGLAGLIISSLTTNFPPPLNYAIGLAIFQLIVIPAGLCYIIIAKVAPDEITAVKHLLTQRANQKS